MLRVAEHAERTHTGRQRIANEDSYFARAPVFAVADGMGGARAGEVASRIAAEAFESARPHAEAPESYLKRVVTEANREIHDVARNDVSRSGMGTTLTAAMVQGDEVSLAHVGDSRAYLLRERRLRQLTSDHSLVEELRRQGRLTEEQAEEHPQRAIITRALGPEPDVDVDTMTYQARDGDLVLLCSDGLTTMLPEEAIGEIAAEERELGPLVRRLVEEANERGGRDNITVVAFRLEEVGVPLDDEGATMIAPGAAVEAPPDAAPTTAPPPEPEAPRARRRRGARGAVRALIALALLAAIAAGAVIGARQVYFLGADEGGRIALYRGLPYELPLGIELYDERFSSSVQASSLPPDRARSVRDHKLRSRADAVSLIEDLERAALVERQGSASASGEAEGTAGP